jgi:hypothetical protein
MNDGGNLLGSNVLNILHQSIDAKDSAAHILEEQ